MKQKRKRTKGIEEARPYDGLSKVNHHAAGVDIGATEIVACVPDGDEIQLVKGFGNYTVDLKAIAQWFHEEREGGAIPPGRGPTRTRGRIAPPGGRPGRGPWAR